MDALIIASLNGKMIYRRQLRNYPSLAALELAIHNAVIHDFSHYECFIVRPEDEGMKG